MVPNAPGVAHVPPPDFGRSGWRHSTEWAISGDLFMSGKSCSHTTAPAKAKAAVGLHDPFQFPAPVSSRRVLERSAPSQDKAASVPACAQTAVIAPIHARLADVISPIAQAAGTRKKGCYASVGR